MVEKESPIPDNREQQHASPPMRSEAYLCCSKDDESQAGIEPQADVDRPMK
jgi:hypothetical protein